ncbi:MAG TPA: FHA domain-containing protein [Nevskiales bacterium]|nr:FHA domain-containing protein [Nevskiales bacterium]
MREIPLDRQRITIGRRQDNDICLEDKATSSQHAAIITIGRNSYLQDLNSTNGTLVNGMPVQRHTLRHGDVILIGRNHLSFLDEPISQPQAAAPANGKPVAAGNPGNGTVAPKANPEATLREDPQPAPRAAATVTDYAPWAERTGEGTPPKDMVDSMLNAIRSHREQERTLELRRREQVNQEWKKLLEAAATLKKRVGNHPRVKFFDIARDHSEVLIRIQREGGLTGQHTILIARQHPHNPSPLETIWLIESGRPDKHMDSCEEIMRDVMNTLAPLIA